jgi:SNF2 family DNA or RNA helicase
MLPLFEHQKASIQFVLPRERTFDTSDPGTGKTRTAIEVYALRYSQGAGACLVIAPKSLLRSAWADDFRKFAPNLRVSIAYAENREKAFNVPAQVYITNTDGVNWLAKQNDAFWSKFKDGMLIIDESPAFKHHTSKRSKSLAKVAKRFKYRHAMTGTPNSNVITDLWHQVFVLDDGQRLGSSFYAFRNNTCVGVQVGPVATMMRWENRPGIESVVGELIKDITIRHKFEDCVDIPENSVRVMDYYLSNKQYSAYQQMEQAAVVAVQSGEIITAVNGAVVMTKLLQIASGYVYDNLGQAQLVDTGRYELVGDLVEERKHSIVFFQWQHQRDALIKELESRSITYTTLDGSVTSKQREERVKMFQQGFYRVMLAQPQSAAHGLTLTKGTTTIWASPTYNLEHWLQGNRRIYRAGQTEKTETIVIVAPGTIEETVTERLQSKDARQTDLLDVLDLASRVRRKLGLPSAAPTRSAVWNASPPAP